MNSTNAQKQFIILLVVCITLLLVTLYNVSSISASNKKRTSNNKKDERILQEKFTAKGADDSHHKALESQCKELEQQLKNRKKDLDFKLFKTFQSKQPINDVADYDLAVNEAYGKLEFEANAQKVILTNDTIQFNKDPKRDLKRATRQLIALQRLIMQALKSKVKTVVSASTGATTRNAVEKSDLVQSTTVEIVVNGKLSSLLELLSRIRQSKNYFEITKCRIGLEAQPKNSTKTSTRLEMRLVVQALEITLPDMATMYAPTDNDTEASNSSKPANTDDRPQGRPR